MNDDNDFADFKKEIEDKLKQKFPDFDKGWNDIVKSLGNKFVGAIKQNLQNEMPFFDAISQFKFSIVIDTNFIFGQIKKVVEKNKDLEDSFIYKLVNSSYIDVHAPFKLQEELFDKLTNVLKVKNELGKEYANRLLSNINIKDAQWTNEWRKANNLIGHIDEDDVAFLALALDKESHAIISNDKIFKTQGSSQTWNINDTDKIITSYNSGFMSFCIINNGIDIIWKILVSIFKIIGDLLLEIISVIGAIAIGAFDLLLNLPSWLLVSILALGVGASYMSDEVKEIGHDIFAEIRNLSEEILNKIQDFLRTLCDIVEDIWEVFKPAGITGLEIAGYFAMEYQLMLSQVDKLENDRAK